MNTLNRFAYPLVAVLSLAAAVSAHAESPTRDDSAALAWTQTKTRAEVQAELVKARADGTTKVYAISYNPLTGAKSTVTREEVRARANVERTTQPAAQMVGEDSGSFYLSQRPGAADVSRTAATAVTAVTAVKSAR